MGLSCVSMKTLKNHEWGVSWANHVYNTEFSVEKRNMVLPYKSRIFCENNVLHTIFTDRAKAFLGRI